MKRESYEGTEEQGSIIPRRSYPRNKELALRRVPFRACPAATHRGTMAQWGDGLRPKKRKEHGRPTSRPDIGRHLDRLQTAFCRTARATPRTPGTIKTRKARFRFSWPSFLRRNDALWDGRDGGLDLAIVRVRRQRKLSRWSGVSLWDVRLRSR